MADRSDRLLIRAPDPAQDRDAVVDLTGRTFWHYFWWQDHCRAGYLDDSFYDWKASRVGFMGDKMVSHYGIWGYDCRIGSATIRMAGIGAVATHGDHRKQSLMARTIGACLKDLPGGGYHMSMLFGIRNFYNKFGYVGGIALPDWTVWLQDLPTERAGVRLRTIKDEWADLAPLANHTLKGLTGTAVRPTYRHNREPGDTWTGHLWTDGSGNPRGYVVVDHHNKDRISIVDQAGDPQTVLRVAATLARKASVPKVQFSSLHYRSALCRLLRQGSCILEKEYVGSGGAMIRTVSLLATLSRMKGELGRRMRGSGMANWDGRLLIADSRERVVLSIAGSRVTVTPAGKAGFRHTVRGGEEIAHLLFGTDEPQEIVAQTTMRLTGDARRLVGILFANQHASLPKWDHY